jgi:LytS/YehU family sensor histidine kinase
MRPAFVAWHVLAALLYAGAWVLSNSAIESVLRRDLVLVLGYGIGPYLVLGVWLYVMVTGVTYALQAAERNARIEAAAARTQLAALRAQLNPHFLFNALHTVVQLIPREPRQAAQAAEQVAGLLRTTIEEDRDLVTLAEEWAFVERYLAIERIRFGDRLRVQIEVEAAARGATVPSFAVQTLVENAVRHGAAPRVEPTTITVTAHVRDGMLELVVRDTGGGARTGSAEGGTGTGNGTGLKRLRERLATLYGNAARLEVASSAGGGFSATLVLPQSLEEPP